jgi:hypothetical protein
MFLKHENKQVLINKKIFLIVVLEKYIFKNTCLIKITMRRV